MGNFSTAQVVEQCKGMGHDRLLSKSCGEVLVIALADGSGGLGGGGEAAQLLVDTVDSHCGEDFELLFSGAWASLLVDLDRVIEEDPVAGETTAIVMACNRRVIVGASVGDSRAMLFHRRGRHDLTGRQHRRPLLGSGGAIPVPFSLPNRRGTLVVASDGLWSYLSLPAIEQVLVKAADLDEQGQQLVAACRLPSGLLPDDLALALVDTA